jgi:hypothetical protein
VAALAKVHASKRRVLEVAAGVAADTYNLSKPRLTTASA